jgi:hypothetical protein
MVVFEVFITLHRPASTASFERETANLPHEPLPRDVFAWEFVEVSAYLNEEFLRQFEGRSSKLSVSPNSQASIRVQAIAAETSR